MEWFLDNLDNLRIILLGMHLFNRFLVDEEGFVSEARQQWGVD